MSVLYMQIDPPRLVHCLSLSGINKHLKSLKMPIEIMNCDIIPTGLEKSWMYHFGCGEMGALAHSRQAFKLTQPLWLAALW